MERALSASFCLKQQIVKMDGNVIFHSCFSNRRFKKNQTIDVELSLNSI